VYGKLGMIAELDCQWDMARMLETELGLLKVFPWALIVPGGRVRKETRLKRVSYYKKYYGWLFLRRLKWLGKILPRSW